MATNIKVVVQGDGYVGKTCLLIRYATGEFPTEYVPTVFDNHAANVQVRGAAVTVNLWDIMAREDSARLRPLSYPQTNCFLACYSIDRRSSFDSIKQTWVPELRLHCPEAAILLVATKVDLRGGDKADTLSWADGNKMCANLDLQGFIECSALQGTNVTELFERAVVLSLPVLATTKQRRRTCTLL